MRLAPFDRIVRRLMPETDRSRQDAEAQLRERLIYALVVNETEPWELFESGIYSFSVASTQITGAVGFRSMLRIRNTTTTRLCVVTRAVPRTVACQVGVHVTDVAVAAVAHAAVARDSRQMGSALGSGTSTMEVSGSNNTAALTLGPFDRVPVNELSGGIPAVLAPEVLGSTPVPSRCRYFVMQPEADNSAFTPSVDYFEIELRARG